MVKLGMVYYCFTHILWDLNGFIGSEWALNCFNHSSMGMNGCLCNYVWLLTMVNIWRFPSSHGNLPPVIILG